MAKNRNTFLSYFVCIFQAFLLKHVSAEETQQLYEYKTLIYGEQKNDYSKKAIAKNGLCK